MILLYKCLQHVHKSPLPRFRGLFCKKIYKDLASHALRVCRKPKVRVFTALSLCSAGVAVAFSLPLQPKTDPAINFLQASSSLPTTTKNLEECTSINTISINTLWSLLISDWPYLIFAILGAFGAAYYNIRIPILLGDIINVLAQFTHSHSLSMSALWSPSIRLCNAFSLQSLCTFAYIGFLASVGERVACRLRNIIFDHVVYQQARFFDERTSSWIIERMTVDVQDFKSSFKLCVSQGLRSIAQVVGSGIAMYTISPTLTATLMGCLPLLFFVGSLIGRQLRLLSHAARDKGNEATEIAAEAFTHIRTVKSLVMESQLMEQYHQGTSDACLLHEYLGYGIGCFQGFSNFAMNGLVLGVLYLGGNLISRGDMDAGQLMAFLVAAQAMHRSFAQISLLFGQVIRGASAARRISELLSCPLPKEMPDYAIGLNKPSFITTEASTPSIRFENVTFSYPNRPEAVVFENLTFEIPAGKVVALVGESGAGKSTVLTLLERFYLPQSGRITINGVDIQTLSLVELRGRLLSYIGQEPEVFHTTVRQNILCARPEATEAEVEAAAVAAQADAFIRSRLPAAYSSLVGGGSSTSSAGLSGGQRQRLVIARALLKNAPILLLDEATSALDAESEFKVQSALQNATRGRTVLIVAHRLSTIRGADLIIVMHRGRIVEEGTHEELIRRKGRYHKLLLRQDADNESSVFS